MDMERTFLGDVEYMRDFFPDEESNNPAGTRFTRAYVDQEGRYFLPSIVGHVRDILPAGGKRWVRILSMGLRHH
jgi:hypothetical protein